jgi:hypothetical protein
MPTLTTEAKGDKEKIKLCHRRIMPIPTRPAEAKKVKARRLRRLQRLVTAVALTSTDRARVENLTASA